MRDERDDDTLEQELTAMHFVGFLFLALHIHQCSYKTSKMPPLPRKKHVCFFPTVVFFLPLSLTSTYALPR